VRKILNPQRFEMEQTSVWSFPERGHWATHNGKYRGNWSPYVPRNLILRYSKQGNWILDQFVGSGTTLIEAKLLGRNAIGTDINPAALELTRKHINLDIDTCTRMEVRQADATNLQFIKNDSIHLICTHPPYADIIRYSEDIPEDLSHLQVNEFLDKMVLVAKESYRVLRPGKVCAFMIGDVRRDGRLHPLGFQLLEVFQNQGFQLKEIIIKEQHNCRSTEQWEKKDNHFLLLAHEYIFVLIKPAMISSGVFAEEAETEYDIEPIEDYFGQK